MGTNTHHNEEFRIDGTRPIRGISGLLRLFRAKIEQRLGLQFLQNCLGTAHHEYRPRPPYHYNLLAGLQ
jgi:hypothetical protein